MGVGTTSFLPIFTSVVYATESSDESEDSNPTEDEDPDDGGTGRQEDLNANVFSFGNANAVQGFLAASRYSESMHYLVTYNTLKSKYTEVNNDSPYAKITKGDDGGAYKGTVGQAVSSTHGTVKTNAEDYIDDLGGSGGSSDDPDDGGIQGPNDANPGQYDTPEEPTGSAGDNLTKDAQVVQDITEEVYNLINGKLTLRTSGGEVKDKIHHSSSSNKYDNVLDIPINFKNNHKTTLSGKAAKIFRDAVETVVYQELKSGTGVNLDFDYNKIIGLLPQIEKQIIKYFTDQGVYNTNSKMTVKVYAVKDKYYLGRLEGIVREDLGPSQAKGKNKAIVVTLTDASKKDEGAMMAAMMVNTYNTQLNSSLRTDFENSIGPTVDRINSMSSFKTYKENKNSTQVKAEGYGLVSWTPLVPILNNNSTSDFADFADALEASGTQVEGTSFVKNNKERLLQSGDLFLSANDPSPLLVGVERWYTQGTKSLADLEVGKEGTGFKTTTDQLHKYVGAMFEMWGSGASFKADDQGLFNSMTSRGSLSAQMLSGATGSQQDWGGTFHSVMSGGDATLGIDNYGNIISSTTGGVILPYWQNDLFSPLEQLMTDKQMFLTGPITATQKESDKINSYLEARFKKTTVKETTVGNFQNMIGDSREARAIVEDIQKTSYLSGGYTTEGISQLMNNGTDKYSKEDILESLSVMISANSIEQVKAFNASMLEAAEKANRLFVMMNNDIDPEPGSNGDAYRWTAASIIQKIGYIFDYGIYETIRLTISRTTASFYNNTIKDAGLTNVFYTTNSMQGDTSSYIMLLMASILALVLTIYILVVSWRVWKGTALIKQLIRQFFMLALVLVIPTSIYGPVTDFVLNQPAKFVLNNQMKSTVILDTYLLADNAKKSTNEFYENMFGRSQDNLDIQLGSYYVKFYTTTDKAGFDIINERPDNPDLSFLQSLRLRRYQQGDGEYPKENLISVNVPVIDLFKWVWDVNGLGPDEFDSNDDTGTPSTEDPDDPESEDQDDPESEEIVPTPSDTPDPDNDGSDKTLFEWLAGNGGSKHTVSGYSAELATYDEYEVSMVANIARTYNLQNNLIDSVLDGMEGILDFIFNRDDTNLDGYRREDVAHYLTASELFSDLVNQMGQSNTVTNVDKLHEFSKMVHYTGIEPSAEHYIPSASEITGVLRDLSYSSKQREDNYGSELYSPFSRVVISVPNPLTIADLDRYYGASDDATETAGRVLPINPNFVAPAEDFLNIKPVVQKALPTQIRNTLAGLRPQMFRNKTLDGDVFEINNNLLMKYLDTYSMTRAAMGDTRNQSALAHAEQIAMATEAFFQVNKVLQIDNFPQSYYAGGITYDKYLAILFIPLKDYGEAILNFHEYDSVIPRSTVEYIVLTSNMFELAAFVVAVILVAMFGLLYVAVFHIILLILIMYAYIKNYVIKGDYNNKAWLGTLMIYGVFGLMKLSLVTVWYFLSNWMNKSVVTSTTGLPNYPHVLINSLVVGAVAGVCILLAIQMIKIVASDIDNLGGTTFARMIGNVVDRVKPRGRGGRGGSTNGKSVKNALGGEGRRGRSDMKEPLKPQDTGIKHLGAAAGRFGAGVATGAALTTQSTKSAVQAVNNKLTSDAGNRIGSNRASYKAMQGIKDDQVSLAKGTGKNAVHQLMLQNAVGKLNRVDSTVNGLDQNSIMKAELGEVLATDSDTNVTTMDFGSAEAAEVIAGTLMGQGIASSVVGSLVHFDSTGYDLTNNAVRAELFKGGINDLQEKYTESKPIVKQRSAKNVDNFSVTEGGDVRIHFGTNGLYGHGYNEVFDSKLFKQTFYRPEITDENLMADGALAGGMALMLKDQTMSRQEVQKRLGMIYAEDNRRREKNDTWDSRQETRYDKKLVFKQLTGTKLREVEQLAAEKSMLVQGNTLYYSSQNGQHMNAVNELTQELTADRKELSTKYQNSSVDLLNYVNKGAGVLTTTAVAGTTKGIPGTAAVFGSKALRKGRQLVKIDGANQADIIARRDALSQISEFSSAKESNHLQVSKFQDLKQQVISNAKSKLTSQTNGNTDMTLYNREAERYIETQGELKNSKAYRSIHEQRERLDKLFQTNRISEKDYYAQQASLAKSYENLMVDTGVADDFSLGVNRAKGDNDLNSQYFASRDTMSQQTGVHQTQLQKLRSKDLMSNSKLVKDKEALKVNKGVAQISYKQDDVDMNLGVDGIHGDTEQFILGTSQNKDYVDQQTSEFLNHYADVKRSQEVQIADANKGLRREQFKDSDVYDKLNNQARPFNDNEPTASNITDTTTTSEFNEAKGSDSYDDFNAGFNSTGVTDDNTTVSSQSNDSTDEVNTESQKFDSLRQTGTNDTPWDRTINSNINKVNDTVSKKRVGPKDTTSKDTLKTTQSDTLNASTQQPINTGNTKQDPLVNESNKQTSGKNTKLNRKRKSDNLEDTNMDGQKTESKQKGFSQDDVQSLVDKYVVELASAQTSSEYYLVMDAVEKEKLKGITIYQAITKHPKFVRANKVAMKRLSIK